MAVGGSTTAVLHLLAISRTIGVPLSIDDVEAICGKVPGFWVNTPSWCLQVVWEPSQIWIFN